MSHLDVMLSMDLANMYLANMYLASLVNVPIVSVWSVIHPHVGLFNTV